MDAFDKITLIPGSRRPIHIPAFPDTSSSSSDTSTSPLSKLSDAPSSIRDFRRKPAKVFKSPSADEPAGSLESPLHKRGTPPYETRPPRRLSTETNRRAAAQQKLPLLPLYHPLGPLAQSSLNIEDPDDQRDGDSGRRSASRAQRPGQKTRERETVEEDTQSSGTLNGVAGKVAQDASARNPSGAKRKRKDTDDGDNAFPPPAKRTRNPRGVNNAPAAPSPLVSEAVVASDLVEDAAEGNADAPKRSARTRKPRVRPTKRRDSSVSPQAQAQAEDEPAVEARVPDDEVLPPAAEPEKEAPVPPEDAAGDSRGAEIGVKDVVANASPVVASLPKPEEPQPQPAVKVVSSPPPPPPPRPLSPPPAPPPQKEEREEGELSDDGPGN
ncbi:hypothetical protein GY45DRAFT_1353521 [Cubamyces sp. BRFM 1775]|nr:hypothetical protein GY45DRAFT_1353521 [Cubamyces sp. BRFM 1775]